MSRVLVYTVSRASTTAQVKRALDSLNLARQTAGHDHDWILWCNSPQIAAASTWGWVDGQVWNKSGENKGQHIALAEVLTYARAQGYNYILKVDDDLNWQTKRWLRKLVDTAETVFKFSGKHPLLAPRVKGLKNPIPIAAKIKLKGIPLYVVPIVGGACRLHHISFFDGYVPDCRRALGAGGDTTIAQHAEATQIPVFIAHWVSVRHDTAKMEAADPAWAKLHAVFQAIPYIPAWRPDETQSQAS